MIMKCVRVFHIDAVNVLRSQSVAWCDIAARWHVYGQRMTYGRLDLWPCNWTYLSAHGLKHVEIKPISALH